MQHDMHAQATDLLTKALAAPSDQRLRLIERGVGRGRAHQQGPQEDPEYARKVCALRDQLAIQLYDVELIDPRQLVLGFDAIRPTDFDR